VLIPYSEVMLVDDDGEVIHDTDARGELYVKGPQIAKGYWRNAKVTEDTLAEAGSRRATWESWTRRAGCGLWIGERYVFPGMTVRVAVSESRD
jgi:acyl-CoA synthetase (AMP-forming)/AMP-acid ligase II